MRRALLVGLVLALGCCQPALAREDFSERDSCYWLVNVFDDGDVDSAQIDHCDAEPDQKGSNDIDWAVNTTAESDVPSGSPSGADSTHHDGTFFSAGAITLDGFASADFTVGGWWLFDNSATSMMLIRYGTSGANTGQWIAIRQDDLDFIWQTDGTLHSNDPDFFHIPNDTWAFVGWSHDAGSGSGTMRAYTSESSVANTLFDCTGGTQVCNDEATLMGADLSFAFGMNVALGANHEGNVYEPWFMAELLSPEEMCHICRCGHPDNVRGVGRVDACNRCIVPDYQGCRRVID